MPSVAFWLGVPGATTEYRCKTPGEALKRRGWDVVYVEDASSRLDVDVLVFQRVVGGWVAPLVEKFRKARPDALVVYDIDDWYDGIPGYNRASEVIDRQALEWVHDSMRAADLITVSTPELAKAYAPFGHTIVLPNYLCPEVWGAENLRQFVRPPRAQIHVGWLGAFNWRAGDIDVLKPWVKDFLSRHPEVTFVSCGGPETLHYLGIEGLTSPKTKDGYLRPYDHLPSMLAWLDIGLAPLTFNRFNECKSWIKPLEYAAMGVPTVASPSQEYRRYIEPGVNGYFARRNWPTQIDHAMENLCELRAGAVKVASRYYIDDHIGRWTDAYAEGRACRH